MSPVKISIVTPCYNMGGFIEGTILSVLNQNYPNLEYIVVDGASTDDTLQVLDKYKDRITTIISEPDHGMYDAINKGFKIATGDVMAYLNADDQYLPGALHLVNDIFTRFTDVEWISGIPSFMNEDRIITEVMPTCGAKSQEDIRNGFFRQNIYGYIMQESTFWKKSLWMKAGASINPTLKYAGDFELWTRFAQYAPLTMVDVPMASFMRRGNGLSISNQDKYEAEVAKICQGKKKYPNIMWRLLSSNSILCGLMRLISFSRSPIITYSLKDNRFYKKTSCKGVSYHNIYSLIRRSNMLK